MKKNAQWKIRQSIFFIAFNSLIFFESILIFKKESKFWSMDEKLRILDTFL